MSQFCEKKKHLLDTSSLRKQFAFLNDIFRPIYFLGSCVCNFWKGVLSLQCTVTIISLETAGPSAGCRAHCFHESQTLWFRSIISLLVFIIKFTTAVQFTCAARFVCRPFLRRERVQQKGPVRFNRWYLLIWKGICTRSELMELQMVWKSYSCRPCVWLTGNKRDPTLSVYLQTVAAGLRNKLEVALAETCLVQLLQRKFNYYVNYT